MTMMWRVQAQARRPPVYQDSVHKSRAKASGVRREGSDCNDGGNLVEWSGVEWSGVEWSRLTVDQWTAGTAEFSRMLWRKWRELGYLQHGFLREPG